MPKIEGSPAADGQVIKAMLDRASQGPSEAQLQAAPAQLVAFCAAPKVVEQLYPWGARRLLRPRMVRALLADLLAKGELATDDPTGPADWAWVWSPATASGPGERPAQAVLDALTPPRVELEEELVETPEVDEPAVVEASPEDLDLEADLRLPRRLDRSPRKREVRARTLNTERFPVRKLRIGAEDYPEQPGVDYQRPRTRAECKDGPRPCPYVSCRHHLYLDVGEDNGHIKFNFPDIEPEEMTDSCSLDLADQGEVTLERVGDFLNVTRERIRQMESRILADMPRSLAQHLDTTPIPERPRVRLPLLQTNVVEGPAEIPALPALSPEPEPEQAPRVAPATPTQELSPEPPMNIPGLPLPSDAPSEPPVQPKPAEAPVVLDQEDLVEEVLAWPARHLEWLAQQRKDQIGCRMDIEARQKSIALHQSQVAILEREIRELSERSVAIEQGMRQAIRDAMMASPGATVLLPGEPPPPAPSLASAPAPKPVAQALPPPAAAAPKKGATLLTNPLDGERPGTLRYRILETFVKKQCRLTALDLRSAVPERGLSAILSMLVTEGKLERPERGYYQLPKASQAA